MTIHDLDTPALVIDLNAMERNIRRLQDYFDQHGIGNRPHIKTHKIPAIAHKQVRAGAIGITCQKIGEVEVMADAGLDNILLTYNIIGPQKLERLVRLAKRVDITVGIDNMIVARGISDAAQAAGIKIGIVIELVSAGQRTGVPTPAALIDLAQQVDRLSGIRFRGMMMYPSSAKDADRFEESVAGLKAAGLSTEIVSGGGTPSSVEAHLVPGLTEHRAGTYVYNDKSLLNRGWATVEDCAQTVIVTVVSRPTADRAIIDGGMKTFSSDMGLPMGYILEYPEAKVYNMNEEHGFVDVSMYGGTRPAIGDRLRIIPNHACGTTNMHDVAYGVRGEEVEVIWDIQARGKLQ
jgi:D-serine deaminase-like pyridoxal phosphate-dependent protein